MTTSAPATDPYRAADADAPDAARSPRETAGARRDDVALADAAEALRRAAGEEYAHLVPFAEEPETSAEEGSDDPRSSRAHQAVFLPGGVVATADMGFDLVRLWRPADGGLRLAQEVVLPRGVGPRHMRRHPSGALFVVAEITCELFWLAADAAGTWRVAGGAPLGAGTLVGDTAAEVTLTPDGRHLHVGVRGSDTLATLRVTGDGLAAVPVALTEAGVVTPRNHLVVDDTLLVAGQGSDDVVSVGLDPRTGVPGRIRHRVGIPAPTCLVPTD